MIERPGVGGLCLRLCDGLCKGSKAMYRRKSLAVESVKSVSGLG